ncbi:MAG: hypothetical protein ABWZ56_05530 [Flavobacterium sp.]
MGIIKVGVRNVVIVLVLTLIISCNSIKNPIEKNNFYYDVMLYNKNLGISAKFFGDMEFVNLTKLNKNHVHKIIKDIDLLKEKKIIAYSKTTSDPDYETIIFFEEETISKNDTITNTELILNDKKNKRILYKKSKLNKTIYLLLKSTSIKDDDANSILMKDGKVILNSITFDNQKLDKTTYFDVFNGVRELDNYLVAREKLKKAPLTQTNEQKWNKFQFLTTINANISNNTEYDSLILKKENSSRKFFQPFIDSLQTKAMTEKNESVIENIIDLAKNEKVVMLNENHWYPNHRLLAFQLLEKLKTNKFDYLAIEAINKSEDSILNKRGFPVKSTGYYTREPYFAHFIRKAKQLGFKIVAYDDIGSQNDRELNQAINIKKIIDKDPDAKIFVYAGIDHILESNPSKKRMAEFFRELTGINPLTFSQDRVIADIPQELIMLNSSVLNKFNNLNTNVDYFIINNIKPSLEKIYIDKEFKKVVLKERKFKPFKNKELIMKVFNKEEYSIVKSNAIPILILVLKPNHSKISFDLPKGEYFIKILSDSNEKLFNEFLSVK